MYLSSNTPTFPCTVSAVDGFIEVVVIRKGNETGEARIFFLCVVVSPLCFLSTLFTSIMQANHRQIR